MGKRKKPKKAAGRVPSSPHTPLDRHRRHGKKLTPPLATLPKLKPSSWHDDWLPEMLWAALLLEGIGRESALKVFRSLAEDILQLSDDDKPYDVTVTGISHLDDGTSDALLKHIVSSVEAAGALKALLLFQDLPARSRWLQAISIEPTGDDWNLLASAVASALYHQSQAATDCRWVGVLCMMAGGKLRLPSQETVREYVNYPDYGDMRKVRPAIRATEMALRGSLGGEQDRTWAKRFWETSYQTTPCYPLDAKRTVASPSKGTSIQIIEKVRSALIRHAMGSISSTAPDAKFDIAFGLSIYSLQILKELMGIGVSTSIMGRASLRILVEAFITLSYLIVQNDDELWKKYRTYGAGQAKLTYLKLEAVSNDKPYVDLETLNELANEDIWQEFLPIDLGHWEQTNLRQMSIDSGTEDTYDAYYSWPSAFVHSHWGAIRDTVFSYCGNPLHRLHRIPSQKPRALPDVVADACKLVDLILDCVDKAFPSFAERLCASS
jgi:hypothetical protein